MGTLIALTDNNTLLSFNPNNPGQTVSTTVTGLDGTLIGIDVRPANGLIYGLTTANSLYAFDPNNVRAGNVGATFVSSLSTPFLGDSISGFDFNPVPDRLRVVGSNNQNFRINVDTGEVIVDGTLAFGSNDANAGVDPNVTAAAYTNSFAGTATTQLFNIDSALNGLLLQNPPNNGTLVSIGSLGFDFGLRGGFDIRSSFPGDNRAFAATNGTLYTVDLSNGIATNLGAIGTDPGLNIKGLTVTGKAAPAPANNSFNGRLDVDFITGLNPAQYLASYDDLIAAFGFDLNAAAQHFEQFGKNEGRSTDLFDEVRYLASYGDLIQAFGFDTQTATEHYVRFGAGEGRATDLFNPASYLNAYADLQAAFGTDLFAAARHYVDFGFAEGRPVG
ncbi:MAG: DUF4394 domain-containing protein [Cyanobacteria bacterium Co-bin13]|nr:DUF4394 domain-containing protein [Cyanobacteria bacterium Co-bin13]